MIHTVKIEKGYTKLIMKSANRTYIATDVIDVRFRGEWSTHDIDGNKTRKHKLSIVSMFMNESMILAEWIEYYINQGVEHFYLIDNGSTDDYKPIISKHKKYISFVKDDTRYDKNTQEILVNRHFLSKIKQNTDWIIFIDCDEYIYVPEAPNLFSFLTDFDNNNKYNEITDIYVPWKIFGSNNLLKQPSCIINSFTKRMDIEKFKKMAEEDKRGKGKSISRTRNLDRIGVHKSNFTVAKKNT